VGCAAAPFCRPQVGKLQEPTQVSSGTNRSYFEDGEQSAPKLWS